MPDVCIKCVIFVEIMRDFQVTWEIFEEKMRDIRDESGILEEKKTRISSTKISHVNETHAISLRESPI